MNPVYRIGVVELDGNGMDFYLRSTLSAEHFTGIKPTHDIRIHKGVLLIHREQFLPTVHEPLSLSSRSYNTSGVVPTFILRFLDPSFRRPFPYSPSLYP